MFEKPLSQTHESTFSALQQTSGTLSFGGLGLNMLAVAQTVNEYQCASNPRSLTGESR